MSSPLRRRASRTLSTSLLAAALAVGGAPLLSAPPAAAIPDVFSPGCLVNAPESLSSTIGALSIPNLTGLVPAVSTLDVTDEGVISWLKVTTDITHSNPGDLLVTLTSPLGDVITLTSGNGGSFDDVFDGTVWDDDAGETPGHGPGSAAQASYADGVPQTLLAPEEALANLRGQGITGEWTLSVLDRVPLNAGTGSLAGWAIEYATRDGGAPDVQALASGTLAGATIPAGGTQTFTYPVTGAMPGSVEDVAADLDISGRAQDVAATLTSPAGTVVTLTNGNGGILPSFLGGTTFADVGGLVAGPVSDLLASVLGHVALVAPQEPLSALLGESTSGLWTLELQNLGTLPLTLNGWGLDLSSSSCGIDAVLTQLTQVPTNLPAGTTFTYAVQAVNSRLAPVTGSLALDLPQGLELVSVVSTLGSCTGLGCVLGTLAPGATATVIYVLKAVTDGVKSLTFTLTHLDINSLPVTKVLNIVTNVTPAAPGGGGGDGSATPQPDTTAPSLMMLLGHDKLATVRKKGILAALGWTEAGRLNLQVKLPGKVAKRLKLPVVIGKRTIETTKAGTVKVRLKLTRKAKKKLAHVRSVRIIVKGKLRDPAGNLGKSTASAAYRR